MEVVRPEASEDQAVFAARIRPSCIPGLGESTCHFFNPDLEVRLTKNMPHRVGNKSCDQAKPGFPLLYILFIEFEWI